MNADLIQDRMRRKAWKLAAKARNALLEYARFAEMSGVWCDDAADAAATAREIHESWHRFEESPFGNKD